MALFLGLVVAIKSVIHLSHKSFTLFGEWWCLSLVRLMLFVCIGKKSFFVVFVCLFRSHGRLLPLFLVLYFLPRHYAATTTQPSRAVLHMNTSIFPVYLRSPGFLNLALSCFRFLAADSTVVIFQIPNTRSHLVSLNYIKMKKTFQKKGKGVWQKTL